MCSSHSKISLLVLLTCGLSLTGCGSGDEAADTSPGRPVNVVKLSDQNSNQSLQFNGVIEAQQMANLAFRVPGTVDKILFKEGDAVKQGQVIAQLDPHDFKVSVDELKARLSEAKASARLANVELRRTRSAVKDHSIAAINLDRAISAQARAAAGVNVTAQALKKAEDALRYSQLKAPFDGVVGQRLIDEHEQTRPGITVMTVHQPKRLKAIVDVPESKIGLISKGMAGLVSWYGNPAGIKAQSTEIASLPDALKRTYSVTFKLDPTQLTTVFPGKAVNVQVDLSTQLEKAFCLQPSAIKSTEGQTQVVKLVSAHARHVAVKVVSQRHNQVCVTGELDTGDTIVTAGSAFLNEGDAVGNLLEAQQ
ncbi:MAG: efflux RND transporter periplasmic adaptor subunit [Pseudomonas marincola]|uniref:efflux RND transporter periplasmic adaptor subunit n=1 Tax=Pseudomonas marincola TaxID=437900 RepID=UPI0030014247